MMAYLKVKKLLLLLRYTKTCYGTGLIHRDFKIKKYLCKSMEEKVPWVVVTILTA